MIQKAINIEKSNTNSVRVLSIAEPEIIENNPTNREYILIDDYIDPPEADNHMIINYPMYNKIDKKFLWMQIDYQNVASDGIIEIEDIKNNISNINNTMITIDETLFPKADKTDLSKYKKYLIAYSKTELANYLEHNPMQFVDGKYYSITKDKQTLLANAIQVYQMKLQAGMTDATLKWNSTEEECTEWQLEDLVILALTIANYVEPMVAKQQSYEIQINECESIEELDEIEIFYGNVSETPEDPETEEPETPDEPEDPEIEP